MSRSNNKNFHTKHNPHTRRNSGGRSSSNNNNYNNYNHSNERSYYKPPHSRSSPKSNYKNDRYHHHHQRGNNNNTYNNRSQSYQNHYTPNPIRILSDSFSNLSISNQSLNENPNTSNTNDNTNNESKNENINPKEETSDLKSCAFATMVIGNDEYLAGALCLGWSLRECKSGASRVLLCDNEIYDKYHEIVLKSKLYDEVVKIDIISCKAIKRNWKRYNASKIYDWIDTSFTKFHCFKLINYKKIIMLDCDLLCLKNCDCLFNLPSPAGICSIFKEKNLKLQSEKHGTLITNRDVERAIKREWGIRGCLFSS